MYFNHVRKNEEGDSAGSECIIWCGVYEQNTSVRVAEYVFTWLHESRQWRTSTSTSVNVANGSFVLTATYFSSPWRYQLEIFTVCPSTQKLNFPRFLRLCDRLSWCYVCFPVAFGIPLVYWPSLLLIFDIFIKNVVSIFGGWAHNQLTGHTTYQRQFSDVFRKYMEGEFLCFFSAKKNFYLLKIQQ